MEIEQPPILRHSITPISLVAASLREARAKPQGDGYSKGKRAQAVAGLQKLFTTFPLTGEGSLPTFYAFSGVETAGSRKRQFSRARFDWLETCSAVKSLTL